MKKKLALGALVILSQAHVFAQEHSGPFVQMDLGLIDVKFDSKGTSESTLLAPNIRNATLGIGYHFGEYDLRAGFMLAFYNRNSTAQHYNFSPTVFVQKALTIGTLGQTPTKLLVGASTKFTFDSWKSGEHEERNIVFTPALNLGFRLALSEQVAVDVVAPLAFEVNVKHTKQKAQKKEQVQEQSSWQERNWAFETGINLVVSYKF